MKSVVFGFSRPKKWKPFAWLIMAYDSTDYDHGYLRFSSDRWQSDFIYQSSGERTNFMGGDYFREKNIVVEEFKLNVPDEVEGAVGKLCVDREGRPYPVMTIVGIILVKLMKFIKVEMRNPWPSKDRYCIGEQAEILSKGLGIYCPLDLNEITPLEFRNWLVEIPGIIKLEGEK